MCLQWAFNFKRLMGAHSPNEELVELDTGQDALAHLGVTHIDIPITPPKVWAILKEKGVAL